MKTQTTAPLYDVLTIPTGRAPFLSAESACIDDFSLMPIQALRDAVAYGSEQWFLTRRGKQVLRKLRAELERRS